MVKDINKLIRHLQTQIAVADLLDSEFVYITKNEAKKCLELAEAEDVILEMVNYVQPGGAVPKA